MTGHPFRAAERLAADALICLRFYTRLPVPGFAFEARQGREAFGEALRLAPVAGLLVGVMGAAALAAARALGLPPLVDATLTLLATILVTGALHEDGLADCADGFGGGVGPARKLEIMRDSRLGSYGGLAIGISLLLRAGALGSFIDHDGAGATATIVVASAAASRGFGLLPLAVLHPARRDGVSRAAGRLSRPSIATACGLAALLGILLPMLGGVAAASALAGTTVAILAPAGMTILAHRQIGGHTGDVAGAAQQLSEIAFLLGLSAMPGFS